MTTSTKRQLPNGNDSKMKVVITGHAFGIGAAIFEIFNANGLECVGYDIQNGKDLNNSQVVDELLLECQTSDIFINNALSNQAELLKKVHQIWIGKNKIIVNISSAVTYFKNTHSDISENYIKHKQDLDLICKELAIDQFPCIMNVRPSWVDTQLASHIEDIKINTRDLAELIYYHISNREKYRVVDIVVVR
jgi:NAD(P)-dependent dehydrogenase (short-subunit alcohol dehydrogenase family)